MTALSIKQFTGMIPRERDHLLPDNAASFAQNCDFSRNSLAPLNGGLEVLNPGGLIRGIYTEGQENEGIFWYTWNTDVVAYKSPVIGEIFERIYYIDGSRLRASPSPKAVGNTVGGPPDPALSPLVGVPTPTRTPVLTLVDRNTLADYPAAALTFRTWWSNGTADFGVTDVTMSVQSAFKKYNFTSAAKPDDAPEDAVFVVEARLAEGTKQLFLLNTGANSTTPARSQALPGGVTMTLEHVSANSTGENYNVNFEWGVVETRAYVFTMQNTWNEESGPSTAALISPTYMQDVLVEMLIDYPTGYRPYIKANIYRTYGGPDYIMAGSVNNSIAPAKTFFTDSPRTVTSTGVSLPSLKWVPPPINMFNLVLAPNGWFAAHYRNMLYMSEPFRPHAWPYSMTFPTTILGICMGPQSLVVTTISATYIVTGPHPHSVTSMEVPIPLGGVVAYDPTHTRRGMCAVEGGVAFLSNDGVVLIEGSQASLTMSQRYFTRETWRALFGAALPTMQLAYYDGCLVATNTTSALGFVLEMDEAGGAMTRFDYLFDVMMRLPLVDALYYAAGGKVYRFRDGTALNASWNSKQFIMPKYQKLGIGFARMSGSGTITVMLYADEALIHTQNLNASQGTVYFRLPSHRGSLKWQFRVTTTGACVLEDLAFGQSPDELKNV